MYSPFYAAAEGLLGVNIFPQRPFTESAYLLDPGSVVLFFRLVLVVFCCTQSCTMTPTAYVSGDAVGGGARERAGVGSGR